MLNAESFRAQATRRDVEIQLQEATTKNKQTAK